VESGSSREEIFGRSRRGEGGLYRMWPGGVIAWQSRELNRGHQSRASDACLLWGGRRGRADMWGPHASEREERKEVTVRGGELLGLGPIPGSC
jgi:hypothetical protein